MNCRVLFSEDSGEWASTLKQLPGADVYFSAEYHRAHEAGSDASARAFVVEQNGQCLFHCFLLRPIKYVGSMEIPEGFQDIETVYGYTGPLLFGEDPEFQSKGWEMFREWCQAQRVIAEFARFNPVLNNAESKGLPLQISKDRQTVLLPLSGSATDLWNSYPSTQRNMVRKALSKGLVCEERPAQENWAMFQAIYEQTMRRAGAAPSYFFSGDYYSRLAAGLGDRLRLFVVRHHEAVAAAALILVSDEGIDYHLSGSSERFRDAGPNNLLLHAAAEWALARGLRWFHLGGGRTSAPDDALLRFKSSLSAHRRSFQVGRRIHDIAAYEHLCQDWLRQSNAPKAPPYFLLYRLPLKSGITFGV